MFSEPLSVMVFRDWLGRKGGYLHPALRFVEGVSGMSVHAAENMNFDSKIISCPFNLAITPSFSKHALSTLIKCCPDGDDQLNILSERELICTYLIVHWLLDEEPENLDWRSQAKSSFEHMPYLHMLPPSGALRTPLHFSQNELSLLLGTNLYAATLDRVSAWQAEWGRCRAYARTIRPEWEAAFTWQRYLTAATYLSSRAFPSTILSTTPSLVVTDSSYPILLPGIDSLNHARAHSVSWVVDSTPQSVHDTHQISLIIHTPTPSHTELFNNYGLKPNSELILGYGFSLPANPDDTIVLKIGGQSKVAGCPDRHWEVGRNAKGADGLWDELKTFFVDASSEEPAEWEIELEAAETLKEMVGRKLTALPRNLETKQDGVRKDVLQMVRHYVEGQRDILQALSAFADAKKESAVALAKADGLEIDFEDDDNLI